MAEVNWLRKAEEDARDMISYFSDEIVEKLVGDGEASSILNDYGGGEEYHHSSHVDKSYSLREAADLLEQLSDFEETDSGLWEGQEPREAVSTIAAYTYGNAVHDHWRELIHGMNEAVQDIDEITPRWAKIVVKTVLAGKPPPKEIPPEEWTPGRKS